MKEIINNLKKLNLQNYPDREIANFITQIGALPVMLSEYDEGKIIYRARPNIDETNNFSKISDLSYKPQANNNKYQRASTPDKTMFYGALIPEVLENDLIDDERITGAFEVVDFLRNLKIKAGEKVITYGVWRVKSKISTYSVVQPNLRKIKVNWLKTISTRFFKELENHPQFKEKVPIILEYLAREFSKKVKEGKDYEYMVSALFAERACMLGLDGILYPSVKMESTGLNIALTPECVDSHLELEKAIKCKIYKKCKSVIVNNLQEGHVDYRTGTITWTEIPIGKYRSSEEEIKKKLDKVICKKKRKRKKNRKQKLLKLMLKRGRKRIKHNK